MQYFYLVCAHYDESTYPQKVFLQEYEATKWGRKEATKASKEDPNWEYHLCRQEITRNGELKFVKVLEPYKENK